MGDGEGKVRLALLVVRFDFPFGDFEKLGKLDGVPFFFFGLFLVISVEGVDLGEEGLFP